MFFPGYQKWHVKICLGDKTKWDVLPVMTYLCGMFWPEFQRMAWDVLSPDVFFWLLQQLEASNLR